MISIAIIDDHTLLRQGYISMLNQYENIQVVYDSESPLIFLNWLRNTALLPQVVLLDIEIPEMSGLELLEFIKSEFPDIKTIVVSMHTREALVSGVIEKGAHSFLPKTCTGFELFTAIETVVQSGFYFNELVLKSLHSTMTKEKKRIKDTTYGFNISDREKEILQLICMEYSSPEISEKLNISSRTVEGHRNNLLQKSGAKNVSGLVMFAVRNGIVDPWFLKGST
jgi:DNA-binding NarL/FixJ family response regulator